MRKSRFHAISILAFTLSAPVVFLPAAARGQIYVADGIWVREYALNGTLLNGNLCAGVNNPQGVAISGSNLYVVNGGNDGSNNGFVSEYTLTGMTVNSSLIPSLNFPHSIAISGSNLFLVTGSSTVAQYSTSGTPVNSFTISESIENIAASPTDLYATALGTSAKWGFYDYNWAGTLQNSWTDGSGTSSLDGIALSGSDLYATDGSNIMHYTIAGSGGVLFSEPVDDGPGAVAVAGTDLYVGNEGAGELAIVEYTTSGTPVNTDLIPGDTSYGIAVNVPEPGSISLLVLGAVPLLLRRRRSNHRYEKTARG